MDQLISNQKDVQFEMVFQEVKRRLTTWIKENRELDWDDGSLRGSLVAEIRRTRYASTIRAAINRSGIWCDLDYYHHLGQGAREQAVQRIGRKVREFKITVGNATDDEKLAPARTFLGRVVERLDREVNEAYQEIEQVTVEVFRKEFQQDRPFWLVCRGRWGRGSGYREDICNWTSDQLASSYDDAHLAVRETVSKAWARIIALLEEVLNDHDGKERGSRPRSIAP